MSTAKLSLSSPSIFLKPLSKNIKPFKGSNLTFNIIGMLNHFISELNGHLPVYRALNHFFQISGYISYTSCAKHYSKWLRNIIPIGTPHRKVNVDKELLAVGSTLLWKKSILHILSTHGYTLHNLEALRQQKHRAHKQHLRKLKLYSHLNYLNSTLPATNYGLRVPKQRHHTWRTKLASLSSHHRYTFTGSYTRCGYKVYKTHFTPTLLLTNVHYGSHLITNHLWFNYTKGFRKLGQLSVGNKIQFNARVSTYLKGYAPRYAKTLDYDLSYPTRIKAIGTVKHLSLPVDDTRAMVGYVMLRNKSFYLSHDRPYSDFYVNSYKQWRNFQN